MFLLLVIHAILLLLLKFTAWPEMLAWPYLMLNGYMPYRDIAIAHTPLLLIDLSIFYKIFGVGIWQLKIYTWILVLVTDYLVYEIARRLWNRRIALYSLFFYILFFILYDGNGLWFDTGVTIFGLLAFYLYNQKRYKFLGIIFGLGLFIKQTFAWFAIPIIFFLKTRLKNFCLGVLVVLVILFVPLILFGLTHDFYTWAIKFGIFSLPFASGQIQSPNIRNLTISLLPFVIILIRPNYKLLPWIFAGLMGAVPRFEFFHFQPALPFLAFVSGRLFSNFKKLKKFEKLFIIFYILGLTYLFLNYFVRNYKEGTRFYEPQVVEVVNYVRENTKSDDKILVLNYWDSIYALSDRLPATTNLTPQLPWYEEKFETTQKPKLVILSPYTLTGLSSYKPPRLYDFVMSNFKLKEKISGVEIWESR